MTNMSAAQVAQIMIETAVVNGQSDPDKWVELTDGRRIDCGTVVSVTVCDAGMLYHADKRVSLHRVYRDSVTFWLNRTGDVTRREGYTV